MLELKKSIIFDFEQRYFLLKKKDIKCIEATEYNGFKYLIFLNQQNFIND
jgi:hypothetical protein